MEYKSLLLRMSEWNNGVNQLAQKGWRLQEVQVIGLVQSSTEDADADDDPITLTVLARELSNEADTPTITDKPRRFLGMREG